jgi:cyanate permease
VIARPPDRGVWQEVARRRVLRVAGTYVALAFAGAETYAALLPRLAAPDWTWRVLLGTAALGFPVAVVLAWTYDITPRGVVMTPSEADSDEALQEPSRAWAVVTVLAVIVGVIVELTRP